MVTLSGCFNLNIQNASIWKNTQQYSRCGNQWNFALNAASIAVVATNNGIEERIAQ